MDLSLSSTFDFGNDGIVEGMLGLAAMNIFVLHCLREFMLCLFPSNLQEIKSS